MKMRKTFKATVKQSDITKLHLRIDKQVKRVAEI